MKQKSKPQSDGTHEVVRLGVERMKAEETLQAKRFRESDEARKSKIAEHREANVSPPGAIPNLPPLLEARRLKYGIPDEYFRAQPCNNRINVFQLDMDAGETYGGTTIIKPDAAQERSRQETPKGILLGGGLKAMDHMRSNGYWIGHVINFVQSNPYHKPVFSPDGHKAYVLVMTCGDVTDSDDLALYLKAGLVRFECREYVINNDDGTEVTAHEHYLHDTATGGVWDPSTAEMLEEEANE